MEVGYIWDTNILIYYLQQLFPLKAERYIDNTLSFGTPKISIITEIELLSWKKAADNDYKTLSLFVRNLDILQLDKDIKLKTIEIRKEFKIKIPDAIIAASALVNDLTLITRNIKDFERIPTLKLVDPWELQEFS